LAFVGGPPAFVEKGAIDSIWHRENAWARLDESGWPPGFNFAKLGGAVLAAGASMAQIPETIVESVRERVDIVDLIGRHVTLKRVGKQWRGLCPFHGEKTPSFYVDPLRKSFKCFGCGEWGDAIDFLRKSEGKSFVEAVRTIGEALGLAMPAASFRGSASNEDETVARRDQAFAILRATRDLYCRVLRDDAAGARAREYQRSRQISDELAELFSLGYAPHPNESGWDLLARTLTERGFSLDLAQELGLVVRSERSGKVYDRFRGRWMFPIVMPGGAVAGFSGRILPEFAHDDEGEKVAKYVNSPESLVYKKSDLLYGLHVAGPGIRARSRVILVEGNVDVLAMHRAGFGETVAPLGTALTTAQCDRLTRFADTAVLCFDGDKAGLAAMWKSIPMLLDAGFEVRVAPLPEGEDPDSVDPERLKAVLERPMPALLWVLRRMVASGVTASPDAKDRALRVFIPLLGKIARAEVRAEYMDLAANLLQVPRVRISNLVATTSQESAQAQRANRGPGSERAAPRREIASEQGEQHAWPDEFGPPSSALVEIQDWPMPESSVQTWPSRNDVPSRASPSYSAAYSQPFARSGRDFGGQRNAHGSERGAPWKQDRPGFGTDARKSGPWRAGSDFRPQNERYAQRMMGPPAAAFQPAPRKSQWPQGELVLTSLLVDRPELASLAEEAEIRKFVRDPRLSPILHAVLDAALQGERQPSEGELLALVDQAAHRDLHDRVFAGNYIEIEDPRRQLEEGVRLCARALIDEEIVRIDHESQIARETGDEPRLRELQLRRVALRQRQAELRGFTSTV
jgi:DNA primase